MSHASNQIILIWKDVEVQLSRHEFTYRGDKLSGCNLITYRDALSLWYLCTRDSLLSVGLPPMNDISWLHFVCSIDVHSLGRSLKDCDSILLRDEAKSYEDLKHLLCDQYPFIGRLLSPMKQIIVRWFDYQSIPHFSVFHSWLCFISRVNFHSCKVLQEQALEDYLASEDSLPSDGFSEEESTLLASWLPKTRKFEFEALITPHHSGGSTADAGRHLVDKYLHYDTDTRLSYVAREFEPVRSTNSLLKRRCKLVFVPKSLLAYRSISMEPSSLMWVQQGVKDALVSYCNRDRRLSRRFRPDDQEPNRVGAWLGSIDGSFATIDLTAASDSVSWSLVRKWFRETFLYRWMVCTRSTSVLLPDGAEMALKKYAPMGSALCFPTETLIFCAITECAIRECGADPRNSDYRVYGDDIVVETDFVSAVVDRLRKNGFTVNPKKSFWASSERFTFRESCGGEYLNGYDVTPCRISRRFSGYSCKRLTSSQIEGLIELANDCYSQYPSVRRRLVSALNVLEPRLRPLFNSTGEGGVFSPQPTNWHLPPQRWSDDYQEYFLSHGTTKVVRERDSEWYHQVEDIRLFEYLRRVQGRQRLWYPEDAVVVDLHRQIAGKWAVTSSPAGGLRPPMEKLLTP